MNKSTLFKSAHNLAKQYRASFSIYQDAFSFALKEIYASTKEKSTEEKLLDLDLSIWAKNGKRRIYLETHGHLSNEVATAVFGLSFNCYKSGSIKNAELNGEKISNNKAFKILMRSHRCYFDCVSGEFVGNVIPAII